MRKKKKDKDTKEDEVEEETEKGDDEWDSTFSWKVHSPKIQR